jgi:hypothetical protein
MNMDGLKPVRTGLALLISFIVINSTDRRYPVHLLPDRYGLL